MPGEVSGSSLHILVIPQSLTHIHQAGVPHVPPLTPPLLTVEAQLRELVQKPGQGALSR